MILREIKKLHKKYFPIIVFLCLLNFITVSCSKPTNRVKNDDKKYLKLISLGDVERDEGNYKNSEKYYEEAKKYDNGAYLSIAYLYYNFIDKSEGEKKHMIKEFLKRHIYWGVLLIEKGILIWQKNGT